MAYDTNGNNAYEDPNQNPDNFERWEFESFNDYKEKVYDRISELLIEKFSEIEPYIEGNGISALQKTYKDGSLVTGKSESDVLVVYESDIEANAGDVGIETALFNWLDFTDLNQLSLEIVPTVSNDEGGDDTGLPPNPDLILKIPDKTDFNMNQMIGTFNFDDIDLKDNVSQFMDIKTTKTDINRSKLLEYVDTEFSELTPITFTQFLEEYNKVKRRIPLYRYRSDDFFSEYGSSILPINYRIEKFFEEFDRIKDEIPAGSLAGVSSTEARTEEGLFGYRTMTYLLKEARISTDDGGVPEYSVNQVMSFVDRIDELTSISASVVAAVNAKDTEIAELYTKIDALGSDYAAAVGEGRQGGLVKNIMQQGGRTKPVPSKENKRKNKLQRGNRVTSRGTPPKPRQSRVTPTCRTDSDCRIGMSCRRGICTPSGGLSPVIGIPGGNGGELDHCNVPGGDTHSCSGCCSSYNDPPNSTGCGAEVNLNPSFCNTWDGVHYCYWYENQCHYGAGGRKGGRIGRRR